MHNQQIGVFWGAFDPLTQAHIAIIRAALALPSITHLIVVINNHSYKRYFLPLEKRKEELIKALTSFIPEKITLLDQDDNHPLNFAALEKITTLPLCAIAGYDAYTKWMSYSNSQERSYYKSIAVVPRDEEKTELHDEHAFFLPIDPSFKHVSSSKQRDSHFEK